MSETDEIIAHDFPVRVAPGETEFGADYVEPGCLGVVLGNPSSRAVVIEGNPRELRELAQRITHAVNEAVHNDGTAPEQPATSAQLRAAVQDGEISVVHADAHGRLTCRCGNVPEHSGVQACALDGTECEPTPHWPGTYRCNGCSGIVTAQFLAERGVER
ncbi:hypothetical protein [Actinopolyspora halophila]|uniref:hypothetical protein n=1 Tax=Actinopolyspora halophila TaxID=1850 RepID=UPI0003795459|nr:hypothetical protein [Actinopolyspora halophila]